MASLPVEDLSCPVCRDIFTNPVVLTCSHSFCKTCLQTYWRDRFARDCPVCRLHFLAAEPPCNRALQNLCEAFKEQRTVSQRYPGSEAVCGLHSSKLQLFCLEDKEPVCLVCRDSRKHTSHHFVPVDEAVQDQREELQTVLKPLEEKLKMFKEVKQTCDQTADHIKTLTDTTERIIKEEFKKLHHFLQEEEEARVAVLRVEEMQKSEKMKEKIRWMNKEIASLSGAIKAIEEELRADDIAFLQNLKATIKRAPVTLPGPQLVSGSLIDVAEHLGNLAFRVWEKMKEVVKFTPVILDQNTAHPWLSLSKDLTSVGQHGLTQQLPDNSERFTTYPNLLASEGFSSGTHSWEVEVGDHPAWNIGVAKESVDRKRERYASPRHGIWCITLSGGKYTNGLGGTLPLRRRPVSIRVQLDWDSGEVSFYDPEYMNHIYTYKDTFTMKLYPYFEIGAAGDAKHPYVKILQSGLYVTVSGAPSVFL